MMPMTDLEDLDTIAENAQAMLDSAQVMVEEMSIKVKQLATVYNYLKMKAPADGVIVQKNIKSRGYGHAGNADHHDGGY